MVYVKGISHSKFIERLKNMKKQYSKYYNFVFKNNIFCFNINSETSVTTRMIEYYHLWVPTM